MKHCAAVYTRSTPLLIVQGAAEKPEGF